MRARLAVFYLAAVPEREGVLIRELHASFEPEAFEWAWPDSVDSEEEVHDLVRRHHEARLKAVGGNTALLKSRRADAVWLDITDPEHPLVEVHEIKLSRQDLASELRQPEKSAAWMQRADRFWLTVPHLDLLDGLVIPDKWGVLVLPFGSRPIVARSAPELTPTTSFRLDATAYARAHAVTRWEFRGDRLRAVAGRYTVASRLRPELGAAPSGARQELG